MSDFFKDVKSVHCVGVKGIGLSALAQILAARGFRVTGSDVPDPFPADGALRRAGIRIRRGFLASHVPKRCDLVIASNAYLTKTAIPKTPSSAKAAAGGQDTRYKYVNVEVREAVRRGIPTVSYPDAVAEIFNDSGRGIAVAGSHGKSTTSALLAVTLEALGYKPTAVIGAVVKNWKSNARWPRKREDRRRKTEQDAVRRRSSAFQLPSSSPFVLEADEYRRAFLKYKPFGAIVTSVDWDHPDVFPSRASYGSAFRAFVRRIDPRGFLVINGDDSAASSLRKAARTRNVLAYGKDDRNALRLVRFRQTPGGIVFRVAYRRQSIGDFRARLFGEHHARNSLAVIGACLALGEKPADIRRALASFRGTGRRFEFLCRPSDSQIRELGNQSAGLPVCQSAMIVDDYAHHPAEIRATIAAARETFPKRRIRVLFQPHTFSRTAAYFADFVDALRCADDVAILKTYASAREEPQAAGRSEALAKAFGARHFVKHAAAVAYYRRTLRTDDVLLTLGAGNGDRVAHALDFVDICIN